LGLRFVDVPPRGAVAVEAGLLEVCPEDEDD